MDPLRYKRPGTQTPRQTPKTAFGSPQHVPKVLNSRPPHRVDGGPAKLGRDNMHRLRSQPASRLAHTNHAAHGQPIMPRRKTMSPVAPLAVSKPTPTSASNPIPTPAPHKAGLSRSAMTLPALAVAAVVSPSPSTPPATRLAQHTPIDMDLPGEDSPSRLGAMFASKGWKGARRLAFRTVAVAMILVITMGGLLFSQGYLKLHSVFRGGTGTAAALKPNVSPNLLKGEGSGRVNILLLGRGGGTHDAPDLTDTMMLASIDPINHTSTLVSLPRDLWVNVPGQGVMKLNAAWETGEFKYLGKTAAGSTNPKAIKAGFDMVDQTVEGVLGVDVNYNMLVDFRAFQQAVDNVGGVNVNVPSDLVDPTMAWENGNDPVLAKAGPQDFDGAKALRYVRSRETTSDFARAERQQAVLLALKSKVVSLGTLSNPVKISGLLSSFGNNVQTDLSLRNAQRLYILTKNISDANTTSVGLADGANQYVNTGNINGQAIVLPKAGLFNYGAIQQFVRSQLKDPFIVKEKAKIVVLNGTLTPDLATNKAAELQTYGYNVTGSGNTPNSGQAKTMLVDLSHGKDKYTKHYLEQRLGVTASTVLPDNTIQTNGADFVIIIGSDEAIPTQSQTN